MSEQSLGAVRSDAGKPRMGLLPSLALLDVGAAFTFGSKKYEDHNWRKGFVWSRIFDAAQRHALAWNAGETHDPESGLNHLAHAVSNLLMLLEYARTGAGKDDRYDTARGLRQAQASFSWAPPVGHAEEASLSAAGLTKGGSKGKTEHQVQCVACLGSGRHYPDCSGAPDDCPLCNGTGKHDEAIAVPQHSGLVVEKVTACEVCRGYGSNDHLKLEPCYRCKGAGVSPKLVVRSISADTGTVIKVREFVEACVACAKHTGTDISDPKGYQADCFHKRAAAYNALPDFLKD